MNKELIERLNAFQDALGRAPEFPGMPTEPGEAADALEAADKRIAELESEVKHYMNAFDKAFDQAMKNGQAANEAKRKLAVAREAMTKAATMECNGVIRVALARIGGDDAS